MTASLGIRVIRSSLVDWWSMKKSADMRGTVTMMKILKIYPTKASTWYIFLDQTFHVRVPTFTYFF